MQGVARIGISREAVPPRLTRRLSMGADQALESTPGRSKTYGGSPRLAAQREAGDLTWPKSASGSAVASPASWQGQELVQYIVQIQPALGVGRRIISTSTGLRSQVSPASLRRQQPMQTRESCISATLSTLVDSPASLDLPGFLSQLYATVTTPK